LPNKPRGCVGSYRLNVTIVQSALVATEDRTKDKGRNMSPATKTTKAIKETFELKDIKVKKETIEINETKKPANLRANAMPVDGYVLSVDSKLKTRFDTEKEAMAAATKLKETYPVIQVAVYDAVERKYSPVELETK
jgi:hypothetical protein